MNFPIEFRWAEITRMGIASSNATDKIPTVFRRAKGGKTLSAEWLLLIFYNICEFQSASAKSRPIISWCVLTLPFIGELAFGEQIFAVMIEPCFFQKFRSFAR